MSLGRKQSVICFIVSVMNQRKRYRITMLWICLLLWGGSSLELGCQRHACRFNTECSGFLCNTISLICRRSCRSDADCNTLEGYTCNTGKCSCPPQNAKAYCHLACYNDEACAALNLKCSDPCESCFEKVKDSDDDETGELRQKSGCTCLDPNLATKLKRINEWGPKVLAWKDQIESWQKEVIAWKEKGSSGSAPNLPSLPTASQDVETLAVVISWKKKVEAWKVEKYKPWESTPTSTWKSQPEDGRNKAISDIPPPPPLPKPVTPDGFPKQCQKEKE